MQKVLLPEFLGWARGCLADADPGAVAGMVSLTGVLLALACVQLYSFHFISFLVCMLLVYLDAQSLSVHHSNYES